MNSRFPPDCSPGGERGALAMVLDISRRLAQANPSMMDPAAEAEATVLIDEINLHLHPKWRRQIVRNLTAAFPKCQLPPRICRRSSVKSSTRVLLVGSGGLRSSQAKIFVQAGTR